MRRFVVFLPLLLAAGPVNPDTPMPMFGGSPSRNFVNNAEKSPPTEFDPKEKDSLKWVAKLGSRSYGGPVIAGGKVFVGTNNQAPRNPRDTVQRNDGRRRPIDKGILMCFEEATGKFLWQHVNDKLPSGQVHDWPEEGVCSTPTVEGERLWYVSNRCEVVCLDVNGLANGNQGVQDENYKDPSDADVLWRCDMMRELNVFPHNMAACAPLVVGDMVYVVTANGVDEGHINLPSPEAPSFLALNKDTGKVVWKSILPGRNIMHGQWSNPTYAVVKGRPQVIFPGGDGWLYGFDPQTGKLLWKFDCNPKNSKYELGGRGTRSDFIGTPVFHDGLVYIGTGQDPEHFTGIAHFWCIDPSKASDTNVDLSPKNDNFDPKAEVNKTSGLAWHYGGPEQNPQKAGRTFVFGRTMSTASIRDGICYIAELDGLVHCLDAKTGKAFWKHDLKAAIWGSTMLVGDKVYLGTEEGDLYVYDHGKELKEPKKIEFEQPIRSTPVMANGVLYVMTESNLYAIGKK
jgi:outer membrane protein assembly factor BamB